MDYGFGEKRNKGKSKRRENRKHPYRKGGGRRLMEKKKNV